jgi:DNA invertase Pin-like site-specific DNA recombinase
MTIRAAIYARTSPDCLLPADDQITHLRTIAAEGDWTIEHVFADRPTAVKADQDRRPAEIALIDAIRTSAIDKVLIWSLCRIGKSLAEFVAFMQTCQTSSVSVYFAQQHMDTAESNGISIFDVTAMLALHLRQARRDRILRGLAAARALSIKSGRPPLGRITIDRAKRELASGKGVRAVARLTGISATSACRIKHAMETAVAAT